MNEVPARVSTLAELERRCRKMVCAGCSLDEILEGVIQRLAISGVYGDAAAQLSGEEEEIVERISDYIGLAIDQTLLRKNLEASQRRFKMVTENLQDIIWVTDPDKTTLYYISPAYERIWGRSREELYESPMKWLESIHDEDRDRVRVAAHKQREGDYLQELRLIGPGGQIHWIDDQGVPVRNADGEVTHIVGIARDITARKKAERELRERIKELRCLYEISAVLVAAATRPTEQVYQDVVDLLPAGFQYEEAAVARIEMGNQQASSRGWRKPLATLRVTIGGEGKEDGFLEIGYVEQCNDQGHGLGPFLNEEQEMLETIAALLGQNLDSRQMAGKLARTERLNALGQLTGGVAHDFNNLLTVIVGNAMVLAQDTGMDDQESKQIAEEILEAGRRGGRLTGRLLAFARQQPLQAKATDINDLIGKIESLLRRTVEAHIEITLEFQAGLWSARIDAVALENCLLNLCLNARDAMPGGGRLKIMTSNQRIDEQEASAIGALGPGKYICISVSDTGTGMDDETMQKAFDPFFSTKEGEKGSGLGLSMVYGFARQSGGVVQMESKLQRGTTVSILLPAINEEAQAEESGNGDEMPRGRGQKILVVEDNALVCRNVCRQLRRLGYQVTAVSNGQRALEILVEDGEHFDLLFTDLVMPGAMSGHDLAQAVGELYPELPILFTSGYDEEFFREGKGARLSYAMLPKPYGMNGLAAAINKSLAGAARGETDIQES